MAIATAFRPAEGRDGVSSALVRSLVALRKRGSAWVRADDAARAAGLGERALARAIGQAEAAGLLSVQARESGTWLRLDRTASSVYGAVVPPQTRAIDPARLGPSPRAPLVGELAREPEACASVERFSDRLGIDPAEVWEVLIEAQKDGLVDLWPDHPAGPSAALSTLAAQRLRLVLAGDGSRWLHLGEDDPTDCDAAPFVTRIADLALDPEAEDFLDGLPDPEAAEAWEELAGAEAAHARFLAELAEVEGDREALGRRGSGRPPRVYSDARDLDAWHARVLPQPRHILGTDLQWPVPPSEGPCPGCLGRALDRVSYCALCHRSGLDHILPPVTAPRAPRRPAGRAPIAREGKPTTSLKGGL